jgi:hypothetical protein
MPLLARADGKVRSVQNSEVAKVTPVLAFSHTTSVTIAEVAFLLFVIAGIWIVFAWLVDVQRWITFRMVVAGALIAVAGVLLIIATHWGHLFG